MIEPPLPPNPTKKQFDFPDSYISGEVSRWTYEFSDYELEIVVSGDEASPHVDAKTTGPYSESLWTVVYWCREYRVPGVCQETLNLIWDEQTIEYRIGALYRYAEFELTERESNYFKYGENPKTQ